MKRFTVVLAVSALFLIGVIGCKQQAKQAAPAAAPMTMPMTQAQPGAPAAPAAPAPANNAITGKVMETMDSGGYTYVLVEQGGQKTWVAAPQTKVKVGQQVTCQPGMVMTNFTSKTLNRTFASIVFSQGIR